VLAAALREARECLLAEAEDGDGLGSFDAVAIGAEALSAGSASLQPRRAADRGDGGPLERNAEFLMRYLHAGAVAETEIVTGRDGVERPVVLVDFEPSVRGCLYDLGPALSREPDLGTGFDLMRFDLAAQVLLEKPAATKVLVPIAWPAVSNADCRQELDRRLVRLGPRARSHLMLAVSAVPRLLGKQRWLEAVEALQRQLAEVGLLMTHREGNLTAMQDAITSEWPLSLLVIDRTEGPPVIIDEYRALFAAARRREMEILVRTTAANDLRDWRALGATMFATAG